MGHGPCNFRESDVKKALRAIEAAGKKVESVEIEDGRIKITIKNGNVETAADDNPWDAVDLK
jgi:coenzyme F420-reducing hydrogenase beta subunit